MQASQVHRNFDPGITMIFQMSVWVKNAPGTVKLSAGQVGTRAKAMGEGAGGPKYEARA